MCRLMIYIIFMNIGCGKAKVCKNKMPLEIGEWGHNLKRLDSVVIENGPVSVQEGQVYVYENYFPNHIIKYVHVDNVAIKSCGANAELKKGGTDFSSVLIVLHADINQEIRSVIDIWGVRNHLAVETPMNRPETYKNIKSLYLIKDLRTVNHNVGFKYI